MRPQEAPVKSIKAIIGNRDTIRAARSSSVADAARLMAAHEIGALPVVDGDRLVGIFSERDVLKRVVAAGRNPATTTVGEVMSTDLVVGDVTESYEVCLVRMQQAHVRHLLALEGGRLAGIVSMRDVVAADLEEKAEELTMLNAYVHYIPAHLQVRTARP
jgi:CBS domain-containing protein